jgi:hypothetical protein
MVVHACNTALRRLRQEDFKLKARLIYIARPVSKKQNKTIKNRHHNITKGDLIFSNYSLYTVFGQYVLANYSNLFYLF